MFYHHHQWHHHDYLYHINIHMIILIFTQKRLFTIPFLLGNHEDMTICRVYGFESEVCITSTVTLFHASSLNTVYSLHHFWKVIEKYDRTMFRAYCEAFTHIPLGNYVCVYVCMFIIMFICMYIYMYVCMYVCLYVCMFICMCVCIYVYMYV